MTRTIKIIASVFFAGAVITAASCSKTEVQTPIPGPEPELITTIRLDVQNPAVGNITQSFSYRVKNGFGSPLPDSIVIDTIRLGANTEYKVSVTVLNEQMLPAPDLTPEIIAEKDEHLFVYESNPSSGAGSIWFISGDKDGNGKPFNQSIMVKTGPVGSGKLTVTLKHEPANKDAATAETAGGETDAEAVFPVLLK